MSNKLKYVFIAVGLVMICVGSYMTYDKYGNDNKEEDNNNINNPDDKNLNDTLTEVNKEAYLNIAKMLLNDVRNETILGEKYVFDQTNTLYLVPVGVDQCVVNSGRSPFSEEWEYFYVGVVYKEDSYDYYVIAKDGSGVGMNLTLEADMKNDSVKSKDQLEEVDLKENYLSGEAISYKEKITDIDVNVLPIDSVKGLKTLLEKTNCESVVILAKNCVYAK